MPEIVYDESEYIPQGSDTMGYVPKGWENHPKYNQGASRLLVEQGKSDYSPVYEVGEEQPLYEIDASGNMVNYTAPKEPRQQQYSRPQEEMYIIPMARGRTVGEVLDEIKVIDDERIALVEVLESVGSEHPSMLTLTKLIGEKTEKSKTLTDKLREQRVGL